MSFSAWVAFTGFWFVFTTSPGPNAINCLSNGATHGFKRSLWGVAAILVQASLFLALAALGAVSALQSYPSAFYVLKVLGAVALIWLSLRGLKGVMAPDVPLPDKAAAAIFWPAFLIAVLNVKSLLGYVAGFSQFIQADQPLAPQMAVIVPTALCLTAMSYVGWTALGAFTGRGAHAKATGKVIRLLSSTALMLFGIALLVVA